MEAIGVRQAQPVHIMSVTAIPPVRGGARSRGSFAACVTRAEQGTFCKFRPLEFRFVEALAKMGAKNFLEQALRNYSVLSKGQWAVERCDRRWMNVRRVIGERLVVSVDGRNYKMEVVEVMLALVPLRCSSPLTARRHRADAAWVRHLHFGLRRS